jgi:hypothetical protein
VAPRRCPENPSGCSPHEIPIVRAKTGRREVVSRVDLDGDTGVVAAAENVVSLATPA